jgi:hypothetical protein
MSLRIAIVVALSTGCSFVATRVPSKEAVETGKVKSCDHRTPVVDAALMTLFGAAAGVVIHQSLNSEPEGDGGSQNDGLGAVLFGGPLVLVALVHGVSALYGKSNALECERVLEARTPPAPTLITKPVASVASPPPPPASEELGREQEACRVRRVEAIKKAYEITAAEARWSALLAIPACPR